MGKVIIETKNLGKQYGKQFAIKNVDLKIEEGMICGLIGPNGAGKTTIMKILGGLNIPTEGSVSIYGKNTEKGLAESRKRMSFMIETPYIKSRMSAYENLEKQRLQKGIPNKERVDEVLKLVGLENVGKKAAGNFSLGMKQRLGIAISLLSKPEIMVMDEPINGLDPEGIVEIRNLLLKLNKEEHITIIISSHILSELSLLCTDYIFINKGTIRQSITAQELENNCKESFIVHTDNDEKALAVLQEKFESLEFDVNDDGSLKLFGQLDNIREISKSLYEGGVIPLELRVQEANLEEYYITMSEMDEAEAEKSETGKNAADTAGNNASE